MREGRMEGGREGETPPGKKKQGTTTKHKNVTFVVVPLVPKWFILASTPFSRKSPKGGPEAPKRIQTDSKKQPKSNPKSIPKRVLNQTPERNETLIFPKCI